MVYVLDIILVAVMVFFVMMSAKKGFISASKNIITLILTVTLLASMQGVVLEALQNSPLGDNVKKMVSQNVTKTYQAENLPEETDTTDTEKSIMICQAMSLPAFLTNSIEATIYEMSEIKNNVMEVITDSLTLLIMRIIALILLFILVRIFVFLAVKILESLFGLPGLKTINKTLGAVIGIVNALLVIYIICGAVSVFTPTDKLAVISETINQTVLLGYFYNHNLLLGLLI
ncbi:MAG: CvpA family protein [Clostridia bacterium]|nr:CvpA family protein [Clostridia bacterium]